MNSKKLAKKLICEAWAIVPVHRNGQIQNIYHATIQKAGSQWIHAIFNDARIKKATGLMYYPQHRYEWDEFKKRFPLYSFVQGLYISYDLYEEIEKPERYKTFFVMRDPRDIVVSWYYSMLHTHPLMGKVIRYRQELQKMNKHDGIAYSIRELALKFAGMRTWVNNRHDPSVMLCKFEDMIRDPFDSFKKIFTHCETDIPDPMLEKVLKDYSKEKMRGKDLTGRKEKSASHYRKRQSAFKEEFSDEHLEMFYAINGNLVSALGY